MACAFLVTAIMPELIYDQTGEFSGRGLAIEVKSVNLPVGAGLGSSAAFSVSVCGALFHLRSQLSDTQLSPHTEVASVPESRLHGFIPIGLLETINR